MPLYDYRCRECDDRFEVRLSLDETSRAVSCPAGHTDTVRIFSPVAIGGRSPVAAAPAVPAAPCGSACGCHRG
jgi:putative FmdB family regulatory protein